MPLAILTKSSASLGRALLRASRDLAPIITVIALFQLLVLHQPFPELLSILAGLGLVIVGLALFVVGLDIGLFPLGETLAEEFVRKGSLFWLLLFADNAWTADRLEDYAQMMYPNYSEMGLPTWVIGAPLNNSMNAPAYFLKVWPEREPACLLTPDEFDPVICKLQGSHCG